MKRKKIYSGILIAMLLLSLAGCKKKNEEEKKPKELNIYVDVKDKHSLDIVKMVTDEYKKAKPDIKVSITSPIAGKVEEDISKNEKIDLVITNRNTMIKLVSKGLLNDVGTYFDKYKITSNYCSIVNSYGRYLDKYYGMAVIPYSIEIFYKIDALKKLGLDVPKSTNDIQNIIKKCNSASIKIPVVVTDDLDTYNALASIFISNKVNAQKLESIYGRSKEEYIKMQEMQTVFDEINGIIKSLMINGNTFEIGNSNTVERFVSGDMPLMICTSYYSDKLNKSNIGIFDNYETLSTYKANTPIIINAEICIPVNMKNSDSVEDFLGFAFENSTQKKLNEKGIITGNIKANEKLSGNSLIVAKHIFSANENSIIFVYNLPEEFAPAIASKIQDMISGKYNKKEWEEIVNKVIK